MARRSVLATLLVLPAALLGHDWALEELGQRLSSLPSWVLVVCAVVPLSLALVLAGTTGPSE